MKKRLNVLMISYDINIAKQEYGDAQKRQKDYAKQLASLTIIVLSTKKNILKEKKFKNLYVIPTNSRFKITSLFDAFLIATKINRKRPFDIITTQDPMATGLVGWALKNKLKLTLNIQLHTEYTLNPYWLNQRPVLNRFWSPVINWLIRQADSLRVDNKAKEKKLREKFIDLKAKIFQAPMRVDINYFWQKAKRKRKIENFISVGRLAPEKNFPLLIKAFYPITIKNPKSHLTIVGGGEEMQRIKDLVNSLNLQKKITLTGPQSRDRVRKLLWKSDVFVLTSFYEGWGLVFIEAFASGLPIICSNVSSIGEIVVSDENGYVVNADEKSKLTEAMLKLMQTPKKAYQFAVNGQKRINQLYRPKKLILNWINGLYATTKT